MVGLVAPTVPHAVLHCGELYSLPMHDLKGLTARKKRPSLHEFAACLKRNRETNILASRRYDHRKRKRSNLQRTQAVLFPRAVINMQSCPFPEKRDPHHACHMCIRSFSWLPDQQQKLAQSISASSIAACARPCVAPWRGIPLWTRSTTMLSLPSSHGCQVTTWPGSRRRAER
jgi:hypothetical protein